MRFLIIIDSFTSCAAIAAYLSARNIVNYSFVSIEETSDWIDKAMSYKVLILFKSEEDLEVKISRLQLLNVDSAVLSLENCPNKLDLICFDKNTTQSKLKNWLEEIDDEPIQQRKLMIKIREAYKKVNKNEILFVKSDGKYVSLKIGDRSYSLRTSLKSFQEVLPRSFIRIHASYIINLSKVDAIDVSKQEVIIQTYPIPFSRQYKVELLKNFNLY